MSKRVAVLTSGGDAPGMNACIRAITLACLQRGYDVVGYLHGYHGLLKQEFMALQHKHVHNLIQRGGTLLHSARCPEFKTDEAAETASLNLQAIDIDCLIVIGGDGSFRGAHHLGKFWKGQILGLPGTIDNDVAGTDATIGYYTAIDTAVNSIDKVRDTADAFERIFLVEVMGRHAGFLALNAALAAAADYVIVPEQMHDAGVEVANIVRQINAQRAVQGHVSFIVVVAENCWPGGTSALSEALAQQTGSEIRPVILGHVQRGGSPVSQDRVLATELGVYAVQMVGEKTSGVMLGMSAGNLVSVPLERTWTEKKPLPTSSVSSMLTLLNQRFG